MTEDNRKLIFCGVLTVSDRCAAGVAEDGSGPNLQNLLQEYSGFKAVVKVRKIVPDDLNSIKSTLIDWVDNENCNLILSTGGTGISPRDVTPEATALVLDRELNAVITGIIATSLSATRFSMLSRMKCGTRGKCFILNLPGSKAVAEECFNFVLPIFGHAVDLLRNNIDDVESFHRLAGIANTSLKEPDKLSKINPSQSSANSSRLSSDSNPAIVRGLSHGAQGLISHGIQTLAHSVADLNQGTVGWTHGLEQEEIDMSGILSVSEAELELEDLENDHTISAKISLDNSTKISHRFFGRTEASIEKLVAEKRRLNTDYVLPPSKVARRDRSSKYPLTPVDKAIEVILGNTSTLPIISVPLEDALGYVTSKDVTSPESIPGFPASIKDGYAVIASDTPGIFTVIGSSIYGLNIPTEPLKCGQAIRITTGSPVPVGADAIVQVEDTKLIEEARQGELEVKISIKSSVKIGQDIRPIGCDVEKGEVILKARTMLGASEIGVLASVGITEVSVFKKPKVAVLSTGNELTEPKNPRLERGQVRDSNRITLLSALRCAGFVTIDAGIAPDDLGKLMLILENALSKADVIISSGGVSMGERDYLKSAIELLGGKMQFGRVLMKPGQALIFG